MSPTSKRILVFFSAALNAGFAVTAVVVFLTHPAVHSRDRHWERTRAAVEALGLAPGREESVTKALDRFRESHDDFSRRFREAKHETLEALARPGPLDEARFRALHKDIEQLLLAKHETVGDHMLEIRRMLGDEDGARFFRSLLEQAEAENRRR